MGAADARSIRASFLHAAAGSWCAPQSIPTHFINSTRRAMWDLDPRIVRSEPIALEDYLARNSYAKPRFGVVDGITFVIVALLLLATGMLASYLPALRAMRVDPNSTLRCE